MQTAGLTEVDGEGDSGGKDKRANQLDSNDELHTEAESAAKITNEDELHQIVDGTVNPSAALREEDVELVRHSRLTNRLWHKDLLALGECPEHESGEVSVFSEEEQILLVEGVDNVFGVVLDNVGVGEDGHPIILATLRGFDAVHGKATWETGYTTEDGLEGLGKVVRDKVLEDLNGCHPGFSLVGNLGLTTETHDVWVDNHC